MEILSIAYLFVALGAGLIGLRFLHSTLKVQKFGGPTAMGLLFSGIFLLIATATALNGISQIISTRAMFVGATISLVLAGTLSLLLVRYVLSLKTPLSQVFALSGFWGVFGIMLALFVHTPQTFSVFLFLFYGAAATPLFFVFHHFFLLSRNRETKEKSFWLMTLVPTWLASISLPLVVAQFFAFPPFVSISALGVLAAFLLSFTIAPLLGFRILKPKISQAPPEIVEFLSSF